MKIEDIIVLVGGRGARLGKITKKITKPLNIKFTFLSIY